MVATTSRGNPASIGSVTDDVAPPAAKHGTYRFLLAATLVAYTTATLSPSALALVHAPAPGLVLVLRAGLAFLLCYVTWTQIGARRRALADTPIAARRLVGASYVLAGFAAVSVLWAEQPMAPIQGAVAYGLVVVLLHGLLIGRWSDADVMWDDLAAILKPHNFIFLIGLFGPQIGVITVAEHGRGGSSGLFLNPNATAMLALLVGLLNLGLWNRTRSRWYLAAAFVAGTALLLSQTRTALGAMVVAVLWVMLRRRGRSLAIASCAAFASILVISVGPSLLADIPGPFQDAFDRFQNGDKFNGRTEYWEAAIHLWEQQPFLGHGFGSAPNELKNLGLIEAAHSTYFQMLLELGLLGLGPFLVLLAALLSVVLRGRVDGGNWSLIAGVIAGLVIAVTESALVGFGQSFCWMFWLTAAAAASLVGSDKQVVPAPRGP